MIEVRRYDEFGYPFGEMLLRASFDAPSPAERGCTVPRFGSGEAARSRAYRSQRVEVSTSDFFDAFSETFSQIEICVPKCKQASLKFARIL